MVGFFFKLLFIVPMFSCAKIYCWIRDLPHLSLHVNDPHLYALINLAFREIFMAKSVQTFDS